MACELTEMDLKLIRHFGALHYTPKLMADNLEDITPEEVEAEMRNLDSQFYKAYEKGRNQAQFKIDMKLFELAQTGDLEAIKAYEKRLREIESTRPPKIDPDF